MDKIITQLKALDGKTVQVGHAYESGEPEWNITGIGYWDDEEHGDPESFFSVSADNDWAVVNFKVKNVDEIDTVRSQFPIITLKR